MTKDELNAIIGDEQSKLGTLAEVQAELDSVSTHFAALIRKKDELRDALAVMAKAKADYASQKEPDAPVATSEPIATEQEPK